MEETSDDIDWSNCTSPTTVQAGKESTLNLLSIKTRERYEITYNQFMNWHKEKDLKSSFSEQVLLEYFGELSKKVSPNSLWTIYSMLRSTLSIHQDIDIGQYLDLKAFLRKTSDGYKPKKSKTLTTQEIHTFLNEAPDKKYLLSKVILIVGISGACRKHELAQLKIDNIEDLGSAVVINVPDSKTKKERTFAITGKYYDIYKKYAAVRPPIVNQRRFFLNYQHQKCTRQPVGINKIANVPKQIASYLHLKEPELYTGHCFRRSSASILVDVASFKRGERNSTVVTGNRIEESLTNKISDTNAIENPVLNNSSSSVYPVLHTNQPIINAPEFENTLLNETIAEHTFEDKCARSNENFPIKEEYTLNEELIIKNEIPDDIEDEISYNYRNFEFIDFNVKIEAP